MNHALQSWKGATNGEGLLLNSSNKCGKNIHIFNDHITLVGDMNV